MTLVVLHGRLRRDFHGPFDLAVSTAAEAIRSLCCQVRGFERALREGVYRVVVRPVNPARPGLGVELGAEDLSLRLGSLALHVVPVVGGAKRGGIGKLILGTALIATAFVAAPAAGAGAGVFGAALGETAILGVTFGNIAMFGATMVLSGISQMLSPQPKAPKASETERTNSFLLGGQLNVYEQGGPIPLVYGRYRVGAVLVAAGLDTAEVA